MGIAEGTVPGLCFGPSPRAVMPHITWHCGGTSGFCLGRGRTCCSGFAPTIIMGFPLYLPWVGTALRTGLKIRTVPAYMQISLPLYTYHVPYHENISSDPFHFLAPILGLGERSHLFTVGRKLPQQESRGRKLNSKHNVTGCCVLCGSNLKKATFMGATLVSSKY